VASNYNAISRHSSFRLPTWPFLAARLGPATLPAVVLIAIRTYTAESSNPKAMGAQAC
jgi:hypothetical protein